MVRVYLMAKFRKGHQPWNKGKHGMQKAWNKGLTMALDDRIKSGTHEGKLGHPCYFSREFMGDHYDEVYKQWCKSLSISSKKMWDSASYRAKMVPYIEKNAHSETRLAAVKASGPKMSKSHKELWKDPEYAKKILHRRTPSGPEHTFIDLCKEFCFVGNGQLMIDGKNPDFVSINNDHKLIEIWGDYYKKGRDPQDLIDFYNARGYQCIVIWASELRHSEEVMKKVKEFNEEGETWHINT